MRSLYFQFSAKFRIKVFMKIMPHRVKTNVWLCKRSVWIQGMTCRIRCYAMQESVKQAFGWQIGQLLLTYTSKAPMTTFLNNKHWIKCSTALFHETRRSGYHRTKWENPPRSTMAKRMKTLDCRRSTAVSVIITTTARNLHGWPFSRYAFHTSYQASNKCGWHCSFITIQMLRHKHHKHTARP